MSVTIMNRFYRLAATQPCPVSDQPEPAGPLDSSQLVVDLELGHGIGQIKIYRALAAGQPLTGFA